MGRFNHLELSDPFPDEQVSGAGSGVSGSDIIDEHTWIDRADTAFDQEDFERAMGYYSRSLQYDINVPRAWAGQVRCLIELGELPEAILWSDRALERFPQSAELLAVRGVAESRFGRHRQALSFVDSAIGSPDVTPYVWVARGDALCAVNEVNAKACYMKAVEMAPQSVEVRVWIARSLYAHARWHQALEHWRAAVGLDPGHAPSWYWVGRCNEELGEAAEAANAYRRALAANPRFKAARDRLASLEHAGLVRMLIRRILKFRKR